MTDDYIRDNFTTVSLNEEFLAMPYPILYELISSGDLNVDSEEQVYEAVMKWIRRDKEMRKAHLPALLEKVRNSEGNNFYSWKK